MNHVVPIAQLGFLLLIASIVAVATRRVRLPYSVGLVAAGMALAVLPVQIELELTPELVFDILLPPLIFEAAIQIRWAPFRRDLPVTLTLAFAGVAVSAAIVAFGMHAVAGWEWAGAGLFGILIAATDPVSVIATFKETKVEPRLALLVESESLLNDGAAAVGFSIAVTLAAGAAASPVGIAGLALWTVCGGVMVGAAVAGALLLLSGRTDDHLVEITLTVIAAYGSFLTAETLHASGVLASLTAGMVVGNIGWRGAVSLNGRALVLAFWEYVAFLANSIVFILIGVRGSQDDIVLFAGAAALAIALVMIGRAAAIYGLCALFARTSLLVDRRHQHVLWWGGLRGALALALALGLPYTIAGRQGIIVAAFGVVAFSIFVQGLTMPSLLGRLALLRGKRGEADPPSGH
jgi:monovalent cation:H+ antiporter, CPA1 family